MLQVFLTAVVPVITILLPRRWLLIWLPFNLIAAMWLLGQLDGMDGPSAFGAYAFVGTIFLVNAPAILFRIVFILSDLFRTPSGYIERG